MRLMYFGICARAHGCYLSFCKVYLDAKNAKQNCKNADAS